ncbi:MAG: family 10 glycosylhydrolase [Bacteroidaceae bacterium]|nr:family 10 glycosylhydrolase [Bacteroidaceae bacterium]
MKFKVLLLSAFALLSAIPSLAQPMSPKREFRGAWIQCVNGQFTGLGRDKIQQTLTYQLDELKKSGINAILFQVRPEADALYQSSLEPWSRFLTGQQGRAPQPYWDPLAWMIDQCHSRGMELHAWINPYRAKTKGTTALAANHPYNLHPERFFEYDGQLIFDPAIPENRAYICHVACDIIRRYDVDGMHIDDYFYPYPANGMPIPDNASYARYGNGMDRGNWRRANVNAFIHDMHDSIRAVKPWVKFGVSPFGIYRNQKSDPNGSATNGLQNYDDLYADVLEWIRQGWVDYNIPQIYWEIGNKAADYDTLIRWWSAHASGRPLYIGQDVERTVKYPDTTNPQTHQVYQKYNLQRSLPGILGSCQWYAKACVDNLQNYATVLRQQYHRFPALQPTAPWIDATAPGKVKKLKPVRVNDAYILFWTAPKARNEMDRAIQYVVYRFAPGERIDIGDPSHIVAITREPMLRLPYPTGKQKYTYMVTALDHLQNESLPVKKKIRL